MLSFPSLCSVEEEASVLEEKDVVREKIRAALRDFYAAKTEEERAAALHRCVLNRKELDLLESRLPPPAFCGCIRSDPNTG